MIIYNKFTSLWVFKKIIAFVLIIMVFEPCQDYVKDKNNVFSIRHFSYVSYACRCQIPVRHRDTPSEACPSLIGDFLWLDLNVTSNTSSLRFHQNYLKKLCFVPKLNYIPISFMHLSDVKCPPQQMANGVFPM